MNAPTLFQFKRESTSVESLTPVRVVDIEGEPFFVARDVALILGYERSADAIRVHCRNAVRRIVPTAGGDQLMTLIRHVDVCRLVMASRLTSDDIKDAVLSQIRDTQSILNAIQEFEIPEDLPEMFIYAIRELNSGNLKLGISRDPHARLKQLQTGNSSPLQLVAYQRAPNRFRDEVALHTANRKSHIRGEWFNANTPIQGLKFCMPSSDVGTL